VDIFQVILRVLLGVVAVQIVLGVFSQEWLLSK